MLCFAPKFNPDTISLLFPPEPETVDPPELGDPKKTVSEEDMDASQEKRSEAMAAMADGDLQKAVDLFTDAIKLNPGNNS